MKLVCVLVLGALALLCAACADDRSPTRSVIEPAAVELEVSVQSGWQDPLSGSVTAAYDPSQQQVVLASAGSGGCSPESVGASVADGVVTLRLERQESHVCLAASTS